MRTEKSGVLADSVLRSCSPSSPAVSSASCHHRTAASVCMRCNAVACAAQLSSFTSQRYFLSFGREPHTPFSNWHGAPSRTYVAEVDVAWVPANTDPPAANVLVTRRGRRGALTCVSHGGRQSADVTCGWVLGNGTDGNPDASRTRPRAPESRTRSRTPTAGA